GFQLPPGVLEPLVPTDNPLTEEKAELGKKLYFDARLSGRGPRPCAPLQAPRRAAPSAGVRGKLGTRNAPPSMNPAFLGTQFWDGRAATLEEQALLPIVNPIEMALPDLAALEQKLAALPEYAPLFEAAFGDRAIRAQRV